MAELVDALVSGTSIRLDVQVRVLFWAQINFDKYLNIDNYRSFLFYHCNIVKLLYGFSGVCTYPLK